MSNRSHLLDRATSLGIVGRHNMTVNELERAVAAAQPRRCRHCETIHRPDQACAMSGNPLEAPT